MLHPRKKKQLEFTENRFLFHGLGCSLCVTFGFEALENMKRSCTHKRSCLFSLLGFFCIVFIIDINYYGHFMKRSFNENTEQLLL